MDLILQFVDIFLHLDKHLSELIQAYGTFTYVILFLVIFCETGLVVTPFLPGDSLLFACGSFAAAGAFDIRLLPVLIISAAFLGDNVNYRIGRIIGPRAFASERSRLFNRKHLVRTQEFYDRHGGKTVIIARFVPIVRTFAPFVAGIGKMPYLRFLGMSLLGSLLWVTAFVMGGYFFGNLPFVKKNFTIVIFVIIFISILPGIITWVRTRAAERRARLEAGSPPGPA